MFFLASSSGEPSHRRILRRHLRLSLDAHPTEDIRRQPPTAGAGYAGDRPTFDRKGVVLEVYLLEFSGDLYGRTLHVEFNDFIRPDHRYDGVEALVAQMTADCADISKRLKALEGDDPIRANPLGAAQAAGLF